MGPYLRGMTQTIRMSFMAVAMFCTSISAQTTLLQENFDAGIFPDGWTQETLASDGGWLVGESAPAQPARAPRPGSGATRALRGQREAPG